MKRTLSLAVAVLIAGGLSAPAFAQPNRPVIITSEMSTRDLPMAELSAFGELAAANPRMARSLSRNPRLAESRSFLRRNPELSSFFAKYPGSKERFISDPGNYLPGAHRHRAMMHHKAKKEMHPAEATEMHHGEPMKMEKMENKGAESKPAMPAPAGEPAQP